MKTFALFFLLFIYLTATQTFAVDFPVNQAGDAGDLTCDATCTLRDAVDDANAAASDDTISFAAGITNITLVNSQITINNAGTLSINGTGANVLTIDGGAGTNRIFFVDGATVTIQGVTLSGGNGSGAAVYARLGTLVLESVLVQNNPGGFSFGAVRFESGTNHRISNSTISNNTGGADCAAFYAQVAAALTVVNTTVSGNSTSGSGTGAICILGSSTATFRNTTISGNTANGTGPNGGGGIYIQDTATVNLGNTIVAGNSAPNGPDLYRQSSATTFTTSGGNLIGDNSGNASAPNTTAFPTGNPNLNGDKVGTTGGVINPLLAALSNNGGTTPTRALLAGSPALDSGVNSLATEPFDQRGAGFLRIRDGNNDSTATVDIGAYEAQTAPTTPTAATVSVGGRIMTTSGKGIGNVAVTMTDSAGNVRTTVSAESGSYRFDEVEVGETYILSVRGKRYTFNQSSQVMNINEETSDINFIGYSQKTFR
jgi:hypothetical protein